MSRKIVGAHEMRAIDGERSAAVVRTVRQTSPAMADALTEYAFGEIFARAELGRRERELVTCGILGAIGGAETQLRVHLSAALRTGVDPDELIALCEHITPYAGFPRALNALREARALLKEREHAHPGLPKKVQVVDHETLVSETGKGEPLVLLHAIGLDWRMWRDAILPLSKHYRVIAYDMRGHGYAAPAPKPLSIKRWVDDLLHLADQLKLEKFHVAGLSLGGSVALEFALQHQDRLKSLNVIATSVHGSKDAFLQRAEESEKHGMDPQVGATLIRWFTPEWLAVNGWAVRYARERILRAMVENWAGAWRAIAEPHLFERLQEIKVATRLIAADLDKSSTLESMREMAKKIHKAKLHVIEGASHMVSLMRPTELAEALGSAS
jgi:3-oxoadipate enol-lactonase